MVQQKITKIDMVDLERGVPYNCFASIGNDSFILHYHGQSTRIRVVHVGNRVEVRESSMDEVWILVFTKTRTAVRACNVLPDNIEKLFSDRPPNQTLSCDDQISVTVEYVPHISIDMSGLRIDDPEKEIDNVLRHVCRGATDTLVGNTRYLNPNTEAYISSAVTKNIVDTYDGTLSTSDISMFIADRLASLIEVCGIDNYWVYVPFAGTGELICAFDQRTGGNATYFASDISEDRLQYIDGNERTSVNVCDCSYQHHQHHVLLTRFPSSTPDMYAKPTKRVNTLDAADLLASVIKFTMPGGCGAFVINSTFCKSMNAGSQRRAFIEACEIMSVDTLNDPKLTAITYVKRDADIPVNDSFMGMNFIRNPDHTNNYVRWLDNGPILVHDIELPGKYVGTDGVETLSNMIREIRAGPLNIKGVVSSDTCGISPDTHIMYLSDAFEVIGYSEKGGSVTPIGTDFIMMNQCLPTNLSRIATAMPCNYDGYEIGVSQSTIAICPVDGMFDELLNILNSPYVYYYLSQISNNNRISCHAVTCIPVKM
jgi:hypothetical protein